MEYTQSPARGLSSCIRSRAAEAWADDTRRDSQFASLATTTSDISETRSTYIDGSQPALPFLYLCTSACVRPRRRTQKRQLSGYSCVRIESIHHRVGPVPPCPAQGLSFVVRYYPRPRQHAPRIEQAFWTPDLVFLCIRAAAAPCERHEHGHRKH